LANVVIFVKREFCDSNDIGLVNETELYCRVHQKEDFIENLIKFLFLPPGTFLIIKLFYA
jgi:hypothetical protein